MKHTLTINQKNTPEHIIHLDHQNVPLNIKPLPPHIAYQIRNTPIHTTTTRTLTQQTIHEIRQKNKHTLTPTILIIIKNTKHTPTLQIQTITENPQITTHTTTPRKLPVLLKQIIHNNTPETNKPITIHKNQNKTYTLKQDNTPIKTYKNKKYTQLIQTTLTTNPELTLQEAEYQAQRKYYKHISYDKTNHTYKITLNKKTISIHKKLQHAIQERNIQTNTTEHEEETLCQNPNTRGHDTEPLPPTPWNHTITQTQREHKKYQTTRQTKTTTHNNPDTINLIQTRHITPTRVLNAQKPDRNITTNKKTHTITKKTNHQNKTYHKTRDKTQARYIRDKLEENNYDKTRIPEYKQQYQKEKRKYKQTHKQRNTTIDYYKNTTPKLKQKRSTKEEYQEHQIQQNNRTPKNIKTSEHQYNSTP